VQVADLKTHDQPPGCDQAQVDRVRIYGYPRRADTARWTAAGGRLAPWLRARPAVRS
jgi:hypothetical protein